MCYDFLETKPGACYDVYESLLGNPRKRICSLLITRSILYSSTFHSRINFLSLRSALSPSHPSCKWAKLSRRQPRATWGRLTKAQAAQFSLRGCEQRSIFDLTTAEQPAAATCACLPACHEFNFSSSLPSRSTRVFFCPRTEQENKTPQDIPPSINNNWKVLEN